MHLQSGIAQDDPRGPGTAREVANFLEPLFHTVSSYNRLIGIKTIMPWHHGCLGVQFVCVCTVYSYSYFIRFVNIWGCVSECACRYAYD